ncbi:hypothetical protein [Candidatus Regiella insecticola]|uniref:hypothetical protein n=1 Tax=Candidatus Regiella insecticola TaxID=138073 RepID=UPI0002D41A67|nr:hypothetical protein [Candidatus Regiella insecticola]
MPALLHIFYIYKQYPLHLWSCLRLPGRPTDEPRHTMKAMARSQQRGGFKGEGI